MNVLKLEKVNRLIYLISIGTPNDEIVKTLRISSHTISTYKKKYFKDTLCLCGKSISHFGRCSWRRKPINKRSPIKNLTGVMKLEKENMKEKEKKQPSKTYSLFDGAPKVQLRQNKPQRWFD